MNDVTPERWAWVAGYEGLYRVSNRGDVWSTPRPTTRGGILKQATQKARPYRWVTLTRDGKQKPREVHKIVMEAFVGPCPAGMEVRHLDGNPGNNCWAPGDEAETVAAGGNLIYGTHAQNMQDKRRHGTNWQLNVTECPQGHEYVPENTMINKKGSRVCLTCKRERGLEAYYRKRDAGALPAYSDQAPEKLARTRELARGRQRRYQRRKRSEEMHGVG